MPDVSMGDAVLQWFAKKGITADTVADFGIRVADDGAVVFPYGDGAEKRRYGVPTGERSFRWQKDTDPVLYNRRDLRKRNLFLCEGETDTIRLRQEIGDSDAVGVVGLPGIETWNSGMADDLKAAEKIWVVLDNDQDYKVAGRVDTAYRAIRLALGQRVQRVVLPRGINDLCEFFEDHNLDSLRLLVDRTPKAGTSRFRTLDLTVAPPPPKWLVEDMLCMGDINLLIGEPGVGKSWLTMSLAVAMADGHASWLTHAVIRPGRVLYVDEENPEDLIHERFSKLGLSIDGAANLRLINNAGIRLDRDPDVLLDEALDFAPNAIILDSLTRLHTEDENSAGAMASLFNEAIKPLARQTGATVVLIHHANKSDSNSGYRRARGSGDITASVDSAWDVREVDGGTLRITNFKSRRSAQENSRYVTLADKPDGSVAVLALAGYGEGLF